MPAGAYSRFYRRTKPAVSDRRRFRFAHSDMLPRKPSVAFGAYRTWPNLMLVRARRETDPRLVLCMKRASADPARDAARRRAVIYARRFRALLPPEGFPHGGAAKSVSFTRRQYASTTFAFSADNPLAIDFRSEPRERGGKTDHHIVEEYGSTGGRRPSFWAAIIWGISRSRSGANTVFATHFSRGLLVSAS